MTASTCAEKEDAVVRVCVEGSDLGLTVSLADATVDTAAVPGTELGRPVLEDVELGFELREKEDFVALGHKAGYETVEEKHLSRAGD